jgi:long-chain acyl-CoA synthetase
MTDPFGNQELAIPFKAVADILAQFRARDPDKAAIVDLDQGNAVTFAELEQLVTDIGADFRRRGITKGDRVVVLSDEVLEKLLLWLGLWRIGAACCPLNVEMNTAHVVSITKAIDPKLVLVHETLDAKMLTAGARAPVVLFGRFDASKDQFFAGLKRGAHPASLPERNAPTDISCIFCTSGTTDKPKVVVYDHVVYWLNGLDTVDCLGLTENDRTLEYRSFGWNSAQVLSLIPFLQVGPTLHIARRFSHSRFFDWIRDNEITFSAGVPTVINMLLNKPAGVTANDVPTLRLMSCSSAPLSPEQWKRFEEMYGIMLLQMYGMSEVGWICGNRHYRRRVGSVGPPMKHQEFQIVDSDGNACPPGVEGEITVGGPQTSIGILREDGSIDPVRGHRIKSGDLAIMDVDGFVRITGRTKDLIIRGGVNISPLEVDRVLLASPGVADAATVGVPDPIYGEELVAFAVLKPGGNADLVLAHCAEKLPLPKRPKRLFVLEELPKSDRGKVLRDKLRERWAELANH